MVIADVHLKADAPGRAELLKEAVRHARELKVDALINLGDLVSTGIESEYRTALEILSPIPKVIHVVGNHEVLEGSLADFRTHFGLEQGTPAIPGVSWPLTVLNSGIEGLSPQCWAGKLGKAALELLASARSCPIVLCHHPVAGTVRRSEESMFGLDNSKDVLEILQARTKPLLLISGHTHMASRIKRGPITFMSSPPLGFWPHAFQIFEIEGDRLSFMTTQLVDNPNNSPDPEAKEATYRSASEGRQSDRCGTIMLR
jgi:predicted phosphodiesterase